MKIKRKLLALLLALVTLAGMPLAAFAQEETPSYTQTIYLRTAEDLLTLAKSCQLDTWSVGKRVVLKNDISLEGVDFSPIPTFAGLFDGKGHTISGLQIDGSMTPAGLFARVATTGIVQNLTVSGTVTPTGDGRYAGGIVGENHGTLLRCTFTGQVSGTGSTGGIAGLNGLTGKVSGCEAGGLVVGSDMTGGIVGCNLGFITDGTNAAQVNTVSVDPTIDPADIHFDFLTDVSKLTSMDVSSAATDSGGIAGYSSGIVKDCTNKATVGYPHIGYNVGGIAGRSCGYISGCTNAAEIYGRKDVGGIAGQMEPYIAKNLTESTVSQLQHQLEELDEMVGTALEHADGISSTLTNRLSAIAGSVGSAANAANNIQTTGTISSAVTGSGEQAGEGSITVTPVEGGAGGGIQIGDGSVSGGFGGSISGSIEGEGGSSAGGSLSAETQIQISTDLAGLSSSLYGMAGQMRILSGELGGASGELKDDAELIRAKINEITQIGFDLILGDGEGDVLIDSSDVDIDLITLGKVSDCTNTAAIHADINTGGIAGCMAMEYALDPEDDITVSIDNSTRRKYEVKAVIQNCENSGEILAKRSYAGGIVGKMDLGLIAGCGSYGSVSSESGDYVGGIAGLCGSTIRHSFAKCTLSGVDYIGGIVGSGVQEDKTGESSTVAACYAMVSLGEHKQYVGAISGDYAGTFLENYFVSEDLAGINRMSYAGHAEPVSYSELLEMFTPPEEPEEVPEEAIEEENSEEASEEEPTEPVAQVLELPQEFRKFRLKFLAEGEVLYSDVFDYGASFSQDIFPELPQKEGYYAYWDRTDLVNLHFDTTVTAVYQPYITALASETTREDGRPVFFAEGDFGETDTLTAEPLVAASDEFRLPETLWDTLGICFTASKINTAVVEQWQLHLPREATGFRYLPPDGDAGHMDVYALKDGAWQEVETEVVGSYVTFQADGADIQVAIVHSRATWWVWLVAAALLLALVLLLVRLIRKLKRRKAKKSPAAPRPKKHRWLWILVILLVLLGILAAILVPKLLPAQGAYAMLKAWLEQDTLAMDFSGEATLNGSTWPLSAHMEWQTIDGQRVTILSEDGKCLYYCDGTVFLENGAAYRISGELPDYSQLLELATELYRHVDTQVEGGSCSLTATGEDATAILELLLPSASGYLPEAETLEVTLQSENGSLSQIAFSGNGQLADGTPYSVNATLAASESRQQSIPSAVEAALNDGSYADAQPLTQDLLRLLTGWQSLMQADPLAAAVTFDVDCGVLDLQEQLNLYRWNGGSEPVYSVEKNGYGLYFSGDSLCDGNGLGISAGSAANLDAAKLPDILYALCMAGSLDCTADAERYTYTLSLDADGMAQLAYAIAPEAKKLNLTFSAGSLSLVMEGSHIRHAGINIRGGVQMVLSKADMAISLAMDFAEDSPTPLPEKVKTALTNG